MAAEPMTGAQFRREVGTDPQKWAREFLVAYAEAAPIVVRSDAERLAFVTRWFRDAMAAILAETIDSHYMPWESKPSPERKMEIARAAVDRYRGKATDDTDPGMRA